MFTPKNNFSLLVVDDDPLFQRLLKTVFLENEYNIHTSDSGEDALDILKKYNINAAIIDLNLPGMDGMTLLRKIKSIYPEIMTIMLTGQGNVQLAVEAIKNGAGDFLQKPFPQEELRARVGKMYQIWFLKEENNNLRLELEFNYEPLIGISPTMGVLKKMITRVGPTNTSILIQGETGTGKELVAKAVHHHSSRKNGPFVVVDCASISATVIESELFGHMKGSFTGAEYSAKGLVRSADGGTLFFDEIGELNLTVQSKLLRMLQEREVRPIGSLTNFPVDIRILAATNRNLRKEVENGRFREDLYYRIQVITLEVPPLRIRKEDIAMLVDYFLQQQKDINNTEQLISAELLEYFNSYNWPGNVRELQNAILRALALGKHSLLTLEDFPQLSSSLVPIVTENNLDNTSNTSSLTDYEINAIKKALNSSDGNRRKAAEILDIGEATLYRKIKKYKLTGI